MEHTFEVGQRVVALVEMINDMTEDGMGRELCARAGEELIVRKVSSGYKNCINVSHENITDRAFCVAPDEIRLVTPNAKVSGAGTASAGLPG